MSNSIIDISNVISVNVSSISSGLGTPSVNNVAFFSVEQPSNADLFRVYTSASEIEADYGTASLTYKMALNIFSQTPNLLSGNGRLIVFPLVNAVSATQGIVETADISSSLSAFKLISDGEFELELNGATENVTGLDFTKVVSLEDVAQVIQNAIPRVLVSLVGTDKISFKSKVSGIVSTIVLSAIAGGAGSDITGASLLNIATATTIDGLASSGETLEEAISRTEDLANYCGIITTLVIEDSKIDALAAAVQSRDMICLIPFADKLALTGKIKDISDSGQFKTRCLLYTSDIEDAQLFIAAYMGRMFSVNFSAANTTITANLKSLANVLPDGGLNQTDYDNAKTYGADLYVAYDGLPRTLSSGGNIYFDRVYNQQQYKFELQTAGFNYLATSQTKIPQTEQGMDGLKTVFKTICESFVSNGFIGLGLSWNSPDKFGNPEDFVRNIEERGYYIYSEPISKQSQAEREERIAPLVRIAVKEAGSIHSAVINVFSEA